MKSLSGPLSWKWIRYWRLQLWQRRSAYIRHESVNGRRHCRCQTCNYVRSLESQSAVKEATATAWNIVQKKPSTTTNPLSREKWCWCYKCLYVWLTNKKPSCIVQYDVKNVTAWFLNATLTDYRPFGAIKIPGEKKTRQSLTNSKRKHTI